MYRQQAFTLIELIVVIVLLGVMAAGAGLLIARPIEAYTDQVRRQQLVDSAEMSLRKIVSDIHRALPNSIRVTDNGPAGWALEMINTVDGARYRDEAGGVYGTAAQILDFSTFDSDFNLLGRFSNLNATAYPSIYAYRVAIYNTNNVGIYNDAALGLNPGVISAAGITLDLDGGEERVTLATPHKFSLSSPGQRVFLVDGPVSYVCSSGSGLSRYAGYAFQASQSSTDTVAELAALAGAVGGAVASDVVACDIDYQQGTPQRGGLITLELSLSAAGAGTVTLLQQVHVDNLP